MAIGDEQPPTVPSISVVVPLYNKAATVVRALQSVLRQSHAATEIVVVDDGSTDDGATIVNGLADARIRLVQQRNAGVSAARNRGISESVSAVIAFLDADDEWLPNHLQTIIELRGRCAECDLFASGYLIRTGMGTDRQPIFRRLELIDADGVLSDYFAMASRSDPPVWSSAVAVNKSALLAIGGFPVGIAQGEDLLTWARLAAHGGVAIGNTPTAIFWQPEFDSGHPTRRPEIPDRVGPALVELIDQVPSSQRKSLTAYIALWHKMRGSMFLAHGDRREARNEFRISQRHAFDRAVLIKKCMTVFPAGVSNRAIQLWRAGTRRSRRQSSVPSMERHT